MAGTPADNKTRLILIFGLLRSGTTLLADLLTSRGKSVVFSEPMLMHGWRQQVNVIPASLAALGLAKVSLPQNKSLCAPADWFDAEVLPHLQGMDCWGMKEVHFSKAEVLIRRYPPDYLLLSIRDPRDLFFSALGLINKLMLAFNGGKVLRDEAWAYLRLRNDVQVLAWIMREYPCNLLRYEDQAEGNDWSHQVSALMGEKFELGDRVALGAADGGLKLDEKEKHGSGFSFESLFRWTHELSPRSRAVSHWLWRDLGTLYSPFGYGRDAVLALPDTQAIQSVGRPFNAGMQKMLESPNALGKGNGQFLFALRAGRRYLAEALAQKPQPGKAQLEKPQLEKRQLEKPQLEKPQVVEFDPYLPALKFLTTTVHYTALTQAKAQREIKCHDWHNGYSEEMKAASHFVFNHVLEFDADWYSVLNSAMDARKVILMTVFLADDVPDWWGDVEKPAVTLLALFAVVTDKAYQLHVSEPKAYGARFIAVYPM